MDLLSINRLLLHAWIYSLSMYLRSFHGFKVYPWINGPSMDLLSTHWIHDPSKGLWYMHRSVVLPCIYGPSMYLMVLRCIYGPAMYLTLLRCIYIWPIHESKVHQWILILSMDLRSSHGSMLYSWVHFPSIDLWIMFGLYMDLWSIHRFMVHARIIGIYMMDLW